MTSLTVSYDARCGLCCAVVRWIAEQPQLMPVTAVASRSGADEMTVTADSGEIWNGDDAWVMVLWALARYRSMAYTIASPALRSTARNLFRTLSAYRGSISCALSLPSEV